jgi:hypothetical protein
MEVDNATLASWHAAMPTTWGIIWDAVCGAAPFLFALAVMCILLAWLKGNAKKMNGKPAQKTDPVAWIDVNCPHCNNPIRIDISQRWIIGQ